MKMNKFFMLGLAGLAFAACSNEEEMDDQNPLANGVGAVSIKIASPEMTRAADATGDNVPSVEVVPQTGSKVIITLTAEKGSNTIELTPDQWKAGQVVTFWNVSTPKSVSVSMNGGIADYSSTGIGTLQQQPAAIPVYGSTNSFTPTDRNESPIIGNDHQAGASNGDNTKKYQIYTATVNLEIPVARLEVSGIKHVKHTGEPDDKCMYGTLTIDGVYMDNVKPTGAGVRTDYQFLAANSGTGLEAILKEPIAAPNNDFMKADAVWPEAGKAYAYNFYAATSEEIAAANKVADNEETEDIDEAMEAKQALNPKFKIYFATATSSDPNKPVTQPRYAMITNYKNTDGASIILEKGKIYRITDAVLKDNNIIGDEGGNTFYGVEVTVKEATWTVETIKADWEE